jgi:hypothetical protein
MIDRLRAGRRLASGAVFAASAFILGGCFDVQYDVTLHNDGSGTISTKIVYDKEMSAYASQKGNTPQSESDVLRNGKPVPRVSKMRDGRLTEEQIVDFVRLSDLTMPGNAVEVTDLGRSILGVDRSRVQVNFGKPQNRTAAKHDEESPEAKKMIAEIMNGHYLTVTLHLPCNVENANTLKMAGTVIVPDVEKSMFHGSTVKWQIPMATVFTSSNKDAPRFDVVCWSWMGIPAGKSKG